MCAYYRIGFATIGGGEGGGGGGGGKEEAEDKRKDSTRINPLVLYLI